MMAVAPSNPEIARNSAPRTIPPLTTEEEDNIIFARITNDERPLKRVIKKFHSYTSLSHTPVIPSVLSSTSTPELTVKDAREAFLVELATFQLSLKKSAMICGAEARQVEEYQRERERIEKEHVILRGQIEQLKAALEDAQLVRRQKMEYDLVTEKINTLPTRDELESSIQVLEGDIAAIRSEHESHSRTLDEQRFSLDAIITQLDVLRTLGKDKDVASAAPSTRVSPAPENEDERDITEMVAEATPALTEVTVDADKEEGEERKPPSEPSVTTELDQAENDIEMGEVEEDPKNDKPKRKLREELEEGEASDASSALSDPPDD